jgi:uncharacterized membrane protein YjjP (DUF1212 family)
MLSKMDTTLLLLFTGMVFFAAVLIFVEWRFSNDAQVFQVIASLVAGFSGAFFGRINPQNESTKPKTDTKE